MLFYGLLTHGYNGLPHLFVILFTQNNKTLLYVACMNLKDTRLSFKLTYYCKKFFNKENGHNGSEFGRNYSISKNW
jgi:hypothetical protein